jgi:hypothetical protein
MIRAALVLTLLATPVCAQSTGMMTSMVKRLDSATGSKLMRASAAACVLGNGDAEATATLFTSKGWTQSNDAEMGIVSLTPADASLSVTLYDQGRICDVTSETIGTKDALSAFQTLAGTANFPVVILNLPSGCPAFGVAPGASVEITSSGNDPVCQSDTTSTLRFTFADAQ